MRLTRTEITAWITLALILALCGLSHADDRPRAPIPRAPLIVETPTPSKPSQPQQKSDLHSHLCSNPGCFTDGKRTEWWHDPTKGPVSHNCPKCGRQQFVVNRASPAGSRSTPLAAGLPSQQVGREPVSKQKVVYVVGSTACYPCQLFKQQHGDGNEAIRYVYAYMNGGRPSHIDVSTWNELVKHNNSGRFLWPFFVVEIGGEFVAQQARVE